MGFRKNPKLSLLLGHSIYLNPLAIFVSVTRIPIFFRIQWNSNLQRLSLLPFPNHRDNVLKLSLFALPWREIGF